MKRTATALILCTLLLGGIAAPRTVAADLKIGVINMQEAIDQLKERIDMRTELEVMRNGASAKMQELKQEAAALRGKIDMSAEGSDVRRKAEEDLAKLQTRADATYDTLMKNIKEQYAKYQKALVDKLKAEIENYGRDNGYDLLFQTQPAELEGGGNMAAVYLESLRMVIYHRPTLDITKDVVRILNGKYEADKGAN